MQQEQESFESLQRLLALKRHETPPPRFLDDLASRTLRKIESTPATSAWEAWLDRMFAYRWFQTAAASGMALLVGGLVVTALMAPHEPSETSATANLLAAPNSSAINTSLKPLSLPPQ
ncbi:MAG: hypothetical protein FJ405_08350 [Verrucomicrobia bacterium]|nr:hypothetical protein [Verrucomicrobiota bacterium]